IGGTMRLEGGALPFLAAAVAGLTLTVGLVAGSYPALLLSRFEPVRALRQRTAGTASGATLRRGLVVFQFTISIFLVIGTIAIHEQLDYVSDARLGIEPERTIVLPLGDGLADRHRLVRDEVARLPGVEAVSAAGTVPARPVSDFLYRPEGWTSEDLPGWDTFFIDDQYAEVLGMEVVRGRDFAEDVASDTSGFLLNEAAWRAIQRETGGQWANPIGRQLDFYLPGASGWEVYKSGPVIGVVRDFHYASMHAAIGPLVLMPFPQTYEVLLAKVRADDLAGTLDAIEAAWDGLAGGAPFDYYFLDDSFDALYRSERRMGQLAGVFAALALLVAGLGLFGLATFTVERRTKEIGIRKVLGASVSGLVSLLSLEYVKLVAVAFAVAAPVAYVALERWLGGFAYRTELAWWVFAVAGLAAAGLALATVSFQAVRAATADPVRSLRTE
ncbi:MAG: FtsX-like permease family protein, partial [Rhodothermales bacterium]|nr:FtsX-like permease family protein [Rhodothermales bacterium]